MAELTHNIVDLTRQSKPVDLTEPYDPAWVRGKTIIVTGGASGFGAGFSRQWAKHGANVIVADINDAQGKALVEELRKTSEHCHYIRCDVTDWQSQVNLFRQAARLSPHGGIDAVVANAGISRHGMPFNITGDLDVDEPPKPDFKVVDINLMGVLYSARLACFWLPRNPKSEKATPAVTPGKTEYTPDRHLLLIGSVASIAGINLTEYGVSKHAVLGLFRSLRMTAFQDGIRVNILMPYFIHTPLIPASGRALLAGAAVGKEEDVVDAGTRLMADNRIVGRALVIGPKVRIDDDWQLLPSDSQEGTETAIWEAFAHDHENVDIFTERFVRLLNRVEAMKGWAGWAKDMIGAFTYPVRSLWQGK